MVEEGKPAPDFELTSDSGESVRLSDLRGKPVVLYFYPKDDTPGCTTQACGIRDAYGEFERDGRRRARRLPGQREVARQVQGQVRPPVHAARRRRTTTSRTSTASGREKKYMGKTYWGVERSTFVIDEDGNVKRVMHNVKPATHADDVLASLRS